jgi:hypothetical protein
LSAHPDPIDQRWRYESEDSIKDKLRILRLYQDHSPDSKKFRKARSPQEQFWQDRVYDVIQRREELKKEMHDLNYNPPERTVWYDMVSADKIANEGNKYKGLVGQCTEARHKGILPPDAFTDETRPDIVTYPRLPPEEFASEWAYKFATAHKEYNPPIWYGQPYHVIIMCEKLAQFAMLQHLTAEWQVDIQILRGHIGYTVIYGSFIHLKEIDLEEEFQNLLEYQRITGKKIVILYLGDWDPDGDVMDETIVDYFDRFGERYGKLDYYFERIAILAEHEHRFGTSKKKLPSDPEPIMYTKDKKGNERYKNVPRFIDRYGGIKQIEIDAVTSVEMLPHFKKLLDKKIGSFWIEEIWNYYKDLFTEEAVKKELEKRFTLTEFGRQELTPYMKWDEADEKGDEKLKQKALVEIRKVESDLQERQNQLIKPEDRQKIVDMQKGVLFSIDNQVAQEIKQVELDSETAYANGIYDDKLEYLKHRKHMYAANLEMYKEALKQNNEEPQRLKTFERYSGVKGAIEVCSRMVKHCDKMIDREIADSESRQRLHQQRQRAKELRKQQKMKGMQQQGVS